MKPGGIPASDDRGLRTARPVADRDRSGASVRLHGLDALRAGALGLGIVLHSLMPFLPVPGGAWIVVDSQSSDAAAVVVHGIHLFRMTLFMALAGYFGRMVLHRRGPSSYLRDRSLRILLPLVVFTPFALASIGAVVSLDAAVRGTSPAGGPPADTPLWMLISPGHLWFLEVLMLSVLITVGARALLVRIAGVERLDRWSRRVGGLLSAPLGLLLAAVPYATAVLLQGDASGGIEQPSTFLPGLPVLVGYLGAFVVGWCLHAHPDALTRLGRLWPVTLGLAVVATIVPEFVPVDGLPLVAGAALVAVTGWAWTYGLIGLCTRILRRESAVVRYLADASYWMYLVHLPVLAAIQVFLADPGWPVMVKLGLAWVGTAVVLLLSYDLLVRDTWLGGWLNGHRRRPWRAGRGAGACADPIEPDAGDPTGAAAHLRSSGRRTGQTPPERTSAEDVDDHGRHPRNEQEDESATTEPSVMPPP